MPKTILVRREGGSKVISATKVIPDGWRAVTLTLLKSAKTSVTVKIEKVV